MSQPRDDATADQVTAYRTLRRIVGAMGIALPLVLAFWGFWLEALALRAFGISWGVKGDTVWRDQAPLPSPEGPR